MLNSYRSSPVGPRQQLSLSKGVLEPPKKVRECPFIRLVKTSWPQGLVMCDWPNWLAHHPISLSYNVLLTGMLNQTSHSWQGQVRALHLVKKHYFVYIWRGTKFLMYTIIRFIEITSCWNMQYSIAVYNFTAFIHISKYNIQIGITGLWLYIVLTFPTGNIQATKDYQVYRD